ncbi:MAG: hypothetical protein JSR46_02230, partial [Verrucomicrobia bacterium]|nr:hypothetical protein [Verrucomicrobiota bacterium]
ADTFLWVQEEPSNMGAWGFLRERIEPLLPKGRTLEYRGRKASSSPAVASHGVHERESEELIRSCFQ